MSYEEQSKLLKIGEVAKQAGVGIETIRYYEREGLLPPPLRQRAIHHAGYRLYEEDTIRRLRFILLAKSLGFTLKEIGDLLGLRVDQSSPCPILEFLDDDSSEPPPSAPKRRQKHA